jgi:putative YhbY family RNA-binding protein
MPAIQLTPTERKAQRSLAHHLDPVVLVGNEGLSPTVLKELDAALNAHGLIKVRVFSDSRVDRTALLAAMAERLEAAAVQHIGKLLVLWRPMPPKPKVEREDRMPGPRTVKIVKFSSSPNHRPTVKKVKVFGNERVTAGGTIKRAKRRSTSIKKQSLP